MNFRLATCVGLWLAEGNNKCNNEITFTNNSLTLINYFHDTLSKLFHKYNPNIRIYIYNNSDTKINLDINNVHVRYYIDLRATKPYFIWRLASVNLMKKWRLYVERVKADKKNFNNILRGFFAGEGNIKFIQEHKGRAIRIAQKQQNQLIETILDNLSITYKFNIRERAYCITGIWNWKKFANGKFADLHPDKKQKFWDTYNSYKENHYPSFYLKNNLLQRLNSPCEALQLSKEFNRSRYRISELLVELKKENKIKEYHIRSRVYWTNNDNLILISSVKKQYLDLLRDGNKYVYQLSKRMDVDPKSAKRRLLELKRLGLVNNKNKEWYILNTNKEVQTIWD